jgi:hypothetical protein
MEKKLMILLIAWIIYSSLTAQVMIVDSLQINTEQSGSMLGSEYIRLNRLQISDNTLFYAEDLSWVSTGNDRGNLNVISLNDLSILFQSEFRWVGNVSCLRQGDAFIFQYTYANYSSGGAYLNNILNIVRINPGISQPDTLFSEIILHYGGLNQLIMLSDEQFISVIDSANHLLILRFDNNEFTGRFRFNVSTSELGGITVFQQNGINYLCVDAMVDNVISLLFYKINSANDIELMGHSATNLYNYSPNRKFHFTSGNIFVEDRIIIYALADSYAYLDRLMRNPAGHGGKSVWVFSSNDSDLKFIRMYTSDFNVCTEIYKFEDSQGEFILLNEIRRNQLNGLTSCPRKTYAINYLGHEILFFQKPLGNSELGIYKLLDEGVLHVGDVHFGSSNGSMDLYDFSFQESDSTILILLSKNDNPNAWAQFSWLYKLKIDPVFLSINNPEAINPTFTLYPNPATSTLHIKSEDNALRQYQITDMQGRKMQSAVLPAQVATYEIDISQLAAGVYLLKVESEKGAVVKRFVKE